MPVYTRRGDLGETDSLGKQRVAKNHPLIEANGQVDELNAILGVVIAFSENGETNTMLSNIQKDLFALGAELSAGKGSKYPVRITALRVTELEQEIDKLESELPKIHHFVLPGGSKTASLLHLARTVCRRAERRLVTLIKKEKKHAAAVIYLNRLGDLLFVMARMMNRKKRKEEITWVDY